VKTVRTYVEIVCDAVFTGRRQAPPRLTEWLLGHGGYAVKADCITLTRYAITTTQGNIV